MQLSTATASRLGSVQSSLDKLLVVFGSHEPHDWELLGSFVGRIRQARRKAKAHFAQLAAELVAQRFDERKARWKARGNVVCRHGVFWKKHVLASCPCMAEDFEDDAWLDAAWMPAMDYASCYLVVAPFSAESFSCIGLLRAQMRRLGW